jgi:hypothetical protein
VEDDGWCWEKVRCVQLGDLRAFYRPGWCKVSNWGFQLAGVGDGSMQPDSFDCPPSWSNGCSWVTLNREGK